jgi:hypothetical protein
VQFSFQGTAVALVWIPIAVAYKVLWSEAQKIDGWSTMPLMHLAMPWASGVVASFVPVLDPPGVTEFSLTAQVNHKQFLVHVPIRREELAKTRSFENILIG